jgi:hypothetical protein
MVRTVMISVTAAVLVAGAWTVNLVCYHPADGLNPLAPVSMNAAWKQ